MSYVFEMLTKLLRDWRRREEDRQSLAHLDDRALRDLGLSRTAADDDGTLPFWRLR